MEQELVRRRVSNDRALVADHRIVEFEVDHMGLDRAIHATGGDEDGNSFGLKSRDRCPCTREDDLVLPYQGAIEVAGDGCDVGWEAVRDVQPWVAPAT